MQATEPLGHFEHSIFTICRYYPIVIRRPLLGLLFLGSMSWGQSVNWSKIESSPDYRIAEEHLADALPNLAIPILEKLLETEGLDLTAKSSLLSKLGESQLRAQRHEAALLTLADPLLVEFSAAHIWRGYTLSQLGHYLEAIGSFQKVDRESLIPRAKLQIAILNIAIGNDDAALTELEDLQETEDTEIAEEAALRLVSLLLSSGRLEEAEDKLSSLNLSNQRFNSHRQFLQGQLELAKKNRIAAVGIFQALLKKTEEENHGLPSPLVHELHLALADSLALGGNTQEGIESILITLGKFPDSPRLAELFQRLDQWITQSESREVSQKLNEWVTQSVPQPISLPLLGAPEGESASTLTYHYTSNRFLLPRAAFALLILAKENLKELESKPLGLAQLESLQIIAPSSHPEIKSEALTTYGLAALADRQFEQAFQTFAFLRQKSPSLRSQSTASALMGKAAYALLNKRVASEAFLDARSLADEAKNEKLARLTALNAGICLLSIADSEELDKITSRLEAGSSRADLLLERGLRLSDINDPSARALLDDFLASYPEHPRIDEASLSLAESYLFSLPRKTSLAREQLKPLNFDLDNQADLAIRRILAFLQMDEGMEFVAEFLKKFPGHPFAPRIVFQQGRAYQRTNEPGKAYQTYESFLATYPEDPLIEVARMQSAISALATGTDASKADALKRFEELIATKGVLATEAAILRVRLFIDQAEQDNALDAVKEILKKKNLTTSHRWRALVLQGEAHYQLNDDENALKSYSQLLALKDISIGTRNRASFLKGRSLKNLDRLDEAFETFYAVVNRQIDTERMSDLEWKWFDECGKGALKLLEEKRQWTGAIKLAEKLSRSGSPSAQDAADRAKRLRLDHFIWD